MTNDELAAAMDALWRDAKPRYLASAHHLQAHLARGDDWSREQATSIAHRLAGSLGSFQQHAAGDLARDIETQLDTGAECSALVPVAQQIADLLDG